MLEREFAQFLSESWRSTGRKGHLLRDRNDMDPMTDEQGYFFSRIGEPGTGGLDS
jgi:hypothetical protein